MSIRLRARLARLLLLGLSCVCCGGAAPGPPRPVSPVRGSGLGAGKPAVKALVIFHPLNDADAKAPRPTGEVAADGSFALSTHTTGDGAPAGEYAVTVLWP